MKSPLEGGRWHDFHEVISTQDVAAQEVGNGGGGVFYAEHQKLGRGRLGKDWYSKSGDSLTFSLAFKSYTDHPRPYLIGMCAAVAAAAVLSCELKWPNDLIAGGKKVGGILTELHKDEAGALIPVVGIGINLNQTRFPEDLLEIATSIKLYRGGNYDPRSIAEEIVERLSLLPEPDEWQDLSPIWQLFDHTPGKSYRLPDGRIATAMGIGPLGQLIASVDGEHVEVYAAEALFGPSFNTL